MDKFRNINPFYQDGIIYLDYEENINGEWVKQEPVRLYEEENLELGEKPKMTQKAQEISKALVKERQHQFNQGKKIEQNIEKLKKDPNYSQERIEAPEDKYVESTVVNKPDQHRNLLNGVPIQEERVNKEWFKRNAKKIIKVAGTITGVGIVVIASSKLFRSCGKETTVLPSSTPTPTSTVTSTPTPSPTVTPTPEVEEENIVIDYGEFIGKCAEIRNQLEIDGFKDLNQAGINSLYFITNYDNVDKEAIQRLVNNGVVSDNSMTIVEDASQLVGLLQAQGAKYVSNQGKNLTDLSIFCERKIAQEQAAYMYDIIKVSQASDTNKEFVVDSFNDLHANIMGKDSNLPHTMSEMSAGEIFTIYGTNGYVYSIMGGLKEVSQEKLNDIKNSDIDSYSTVIGQLNSCIENANSTKETEKTK